MARRGEKVVIRILDKTNLRGTLGDLGLPARELDAAPSGCWGTARAWCSSPGPTGQRQDHHALRGAERAQDGEGEHRHGGGSRSNTTSPGISQIQVSEPQGLTFAKALRSVLRQDPDIVLVGEIRDLETATTAVQAGFSGHFVLSTLHTNDAPSAVIRLRDMGDRGVQDRRRSSRAWWRSGWCGSSAPPAPQIVPADSLPHRGTPAGGPRGDRGPQGDRLQQLRRDRAIAAGWRSSRSCRWTSRCPA